MFRHLPTAYADVDAGDLRWTLDHPSLPALASLPISCGDLQIELRILGTSHQVVVADTDRTRWSETIACGLDGAPLPDRAHREQPDVPYLLTYLLTCSVLQLPTDEFETRVDALTRTLQDHPDALVGAFPGEQRAITALTLETAPEEPARPATPGLPAIPGLPGLPEAPGLPETVEIAETGRTTVPAEDAPTGRVLGWRTWHSYPRTGHVVATRSLLSLSQHAPAPSPVGGAG